MEYAKADQAVDDFRFKMAEIDILGGLVGLFQASYLGVRRSSLAVITTLVKFSTLLTLLYFKVCKG